MNVFEIIKEYVGEVSVTDLLLCLSGSLLLAGWLLRTSLGARSLDHSAPRRNNMPLFLPLLILFVSYFFIAFVVVIGALLVVQVSLDYGDTVDYWWTAGVFSIIWIVLYFERKK